LSSTCSPSDTWVPPTRALEQFAAACTAQGCQVHLVASKDSIVYRVITIVGLHKRMPVFPTLDQALRDDG
jgi:hypothetical protein